MGAFFTYHFSYPWEPLAEKAPLDEMKTWRGNPAWAWLCVCNVSLLHHDWLISGGIDWAGNMCPQEGKGTPGQSFKSADQLVAVTVDQQRFLQRNLAQRLFLILRSLPFFCHKDLDRGWPRLFGWCNEPYFRSKAFSEVRLIFVSTQSELYCCYCD